MSRMKANMCEPKPLAKTSGWFMGGVPGQQLQSCHTNTDRECGESGREIILIPSYPHCNAAQKTGNVHFSLISRGCAQLESFQKIIIIIVFSGHFRVDFPTKERDFP